MGTDCPEGVDLGFWKWVWDYPSSSRPGTIAWIDQCRAGRRIEVRKSPRQVRAFLDGVRADQAGELAASVT